MGTSIYKGDAARHQPQIPTQKSSNALQVFVGHVLDVNYEEPYPGTIRVKLISVDRKEEDTITRIAFPVDKTLIKYPLPGELVFLLNGLGSDTIKGKIGTQLYYITTITSNNSITFNSNPYYSSLETTKSGGAVFTGDYETRFEKKITNYSAYKNIFGSKKVIERQKLKPLEGDFIIQSRFGSGIRLGSTGKETTGLSFSDRIGKSGEPHLLMSVGVKSDSTSSRVENVNADAASIYLCSKQTIPIVLGCSSELKTHKVVYNFTDIKPDRDNTIFLDTPIVNYSEFVESYNENNPANPLPTGSEATMSVQVKETINNYLVSQSIVQGSGTPPPGAPTTQPPNTRYDIAGNLIVSIPTSNSTSYPMLIVFGGIDYATHIWMYNQINATILSKYVVVTANYINQFGGVKQKADEFVASKNIKTTTVSITGFSAGALSIQDVYAPNFSLVGLIDPSTRSKYQSVSYGANTVMVYNDSNWGGYPEIKALLPPLSNKIRAGGGIGEQVSLQHNQIPKYFFDKYIR